MKNFPLQTFFLIYAPLQTFFFSKCKLFFLDISCLQAIFFCLFRPCKQFYFSIFFISPLQINNGLSLRFRNVHLAWGGRGGGGSVPDMSYIGMCHCAGYGFQSH